MPTMTNTLQKMMNASGKCDCSNDVVGKAIGSGKGRNSQFDSGWDEQGRNQHFACTRCVLVGLVYDQ